MKAKLTAFFILVACAAFGQDSNILISLGLPAYGVKIKNNFPYSSGGFARAFMLSNEDASVDFAGLGVYGQYSGGVSTMIYAFLGPSYSNAFMVFKPNGNVGVGTTAPTEKLSVKGKIRAQEVKVEMANWSDFVFAKDYVLPTLQETEKHIKEKGHLSGIPSAEEVEKNGVELGDMNKKLLQKIEELTMYLIEQNKRMEKMDKEMQVLKSKVL